ncbi:biotin/lipoyl-binding protein [Microtetraspora sp. AC03309]|uniref:efflux RND transporter periplasmic adaptor subunit n=1 Tax=Microtetraspora sp. AC03309 TaxID=2779376 RepID=UPI001E45034D|nr:biotin/lipoyl-binding protein [Microtetraspora sp. AC03309]MCC5577412.1 biotin/lipoyl-binding protein [Microtetraspora sp. AC03309]
MKLSTRRRALIVNGTLGVLVAGGAVAAYLSLAGTAAGPASAAGGSTVTVGRGTVLDSVSASGSLESARSASLDFRTSGTISSINVKEGQKVKKGQVLARLDGSSLRDDLTAASASLTVAKEQNESQATASSYSQYVKALNSYKSAKRALAETVLKAPFSATVTAINGVIGDTAGSSSGGGGGASSGGASSGGGAAGASSGGSSSGSSGTIELIDTSRMQIVGNFTESDVTKLKVGQAATISFDALSGVTAQGRVSIINPVATTSNNVVQYPVTVTLTEIPDGVRLGQTATVAVVVDKAENVVTVPTSVITTTGGRTTVTLLRDGQRVTQTVEVGVEGDDTAEIRSGVSEGDQLVRPATTSGGTSGSTGTGGGRMQGGFGTGGGGMPGGMPGGGGGPAGGR